MSAILNAIDRRIGGRFNWLINTIGSSYCTAKDVITGEAVLSVHHLSSEELELKARKQLVTQIDNLDDTQLKMMQSEIHKRLNSARK